MNKKNRDASASALKRFVSHLPILFYKYKGMLTIKIKIPFWRGFSINYMYGKKRWHTGKHTIMVMSLHYPSHWHGWCCGHWKFYHTGEYIGRNKDANS